MKYDVDKLRRDMEEEDMGAFFVGGYGGALSEYSDIEDADDDELIEMAQRNGINLSRYKKY